MLTGYKAWKLIQESFNGSYTLGIKTPPSLGITGSKLSEMGFGPKHHDLDDEEEDDLDDLGGKEGDDLDGLDGLGGEEGDDLDGLDGMAGDNDFDSLAGLEPEQGDDLAGMLGQDNDVDSDNLDFTDLAADKDGMEEPGDKSPSKGANPFGGEEDGEEGDEDEEGDFDDDGDEDDFEDDEDEKDEKGGKPLFAKKSKKFMKKDNETVYSKKFMKADDKKHMCGGAEDERYSDDKQENSFFSNLVNQGTGDVHKKFKSGMPAMKEELLFTPVDPNLVPTTRSGPGDPGFAPTGRVGFFGNVTEPASVTEARKQRATLTEARRVLGTRMNKASADQLSRIAEILSQK